MIGRLSLHDQRLNNVVHLPNLCPGLVDSFTGRRAKLLIFAVSKVCIVMVFVRNRTAMLVFRTAIADVGSFVQSAALFPFEAFADLIALVTGSTLLVTDEELFADVGSFASKAVDAEVVRISKTALVPGIGAAVKPHLLGDCGRVLTKELGDILERKPLIKRRLDV